MVILRSTDCAPKGCRRGRRSLWKNRDGVAAIEFAIVGPAFLALLLAILYTVMIYLAQQMLQTSAETAGRLLLTGSAQTMSTNGHTGLTSADFKNAICNGITGTDASGNSVSIPASLPSMLSCSRLTVNVTTASTYNVASTASPTFTYNSSGVLTTTGAFNFQSNGNGKSRIVIVQLIYLLPTGKGPLDLNLIDEPNANHKIVATSVFTTEDYSCSAS
ncbi:MAG: TadE/TadG family type IV pilus assembly protein, partial [Sphingomonas sp.]